METDSESFVNLNVGGVVFGTTRSTLTKYDGFFKNTLESRDASENNEIGTIFIDRDPTHFRSVLNFMRDGNTPIPESKIEKDQLLQEATYYKLEGLVYLCGGEPSDEWKRANFEIRYTSDYATQKAFIDNRVGEEKLRMVIDWNTLIWGDIQTNLIALEFVRNYKNTWDILFFESTEDELMISVRKPNNSGWATILTVSYNKNISEHFRHVEDSMRL